ncbi:MAG: CDGSH-type Zn-finger protein [Cyclobacteriaceae bacterium]|jgi:CDGSH-type Zn-finger protein
MDTPKIAAKQPIAVELEAGKKYAWCTCGHSANQPFCDGSHKETGMTPNMMTVNETKTYYMCQCKHTKNPGFCDGSHKDL